MPGEFHLDGGAFKWVADSADVGTEPDLSALAGVTIEFVCNIPGNKPLPIPGGVMFVTKRTATVGEDGQLFDEQGNPGIDLLGNDTNFQLPVQVQWKVTFGRFDHNGKSIRPVSYWFDAPEPGSVVTIDELTPVPGIEQPGATRGARGYTPWFIPIEGTDPQLYQPTDPNGPVGPPIPFEAIVDPSQIVSVVDDAVPGLVAQAIAADGTVAAAAAAATDAEIAGRDLVQRSDPGIPRETDMTTANYQQVWLGPNGEFIRGDRTDGVVEIDTLETKNFTPERIEIAGGVTEEIDAEGVLWVPYLGPDGHLPELYLDEEGNVPNSTLAAWKQRGNFGSGGTTSTPLDLIILAGQSNATQRSSLPVVVDPPIADVLEWNGTTFAPVAGVPWLGSGFARRYQEMHGRPEARRTAVIKASLGSTGFSTSTPGTWDRTVTTGADRYLYPEMIAKAQAALAAAPVGSTIKCVLWSQGEADRSIAATTYASKLDDLIATARADLGLPDLPFIISSLVPEWLVYLASVNDGRGAIMEAVLEDTPRRVLRTSFIRGRAGLCEAIVSSNGIHWQPLGQKLRGIAMAEVGLDMALLNVVTAEAQPPQNARISRSGSVVTIEWDHPQNRATAYTLTTTVDSGATWVTQILSAATTHKHVMTVPAGTPLWAKLIATNETGDSFPVEVHA